MQPRCSRDVSQDTSPKSPLPGKPSGNACPQTTDHATRRLTEPTHRKKCVLSISLASGDPRQAVAGRVGRGLLRKGGVVARPRRRATQGGGQRRGRHRLAEGVECAVERSLCRSLPHRERRPGRSDDDVGLERGEQRRSECPSSPSQDTCLTRPGTRPSQDQCRSKCAAAADCVAFEHARPGGYPKCELHRTRIARTSPNPTAKCWVKKKGVDWSRYTPPETLAARVARVVFPAAIFGE